MAFSCYGAKNSNCSKVKCAQIQTQSPDFFTLREITITKHELANVNFFWRLGLNLQYALTALHFNK